MDKILLISPHFSEYALRLGEALGEYHQIYILLDEKNYSKELDARPPAWLSQNVNVYTSRFGDGYSIFTDIINILVLILRIRPNIVHIQEPSGLRKALILSIITCVCRAISKVVLTVHDPLPHSGSDSLVERKIRFFRFAMRRQIKNILVHGESCREALLSSGAYERKNIAITTHGILMTKGVRADRKQKGSYFLVYGRMEAYKGIEILADALDILDERSVVYDLRILGAGPELDRFERRLSSNTKVKVRNRFIQRNELIAALEEAYCVLLPYTNATQSGVLAGAFGNGCPVIASRTGGLCDVAEDGNNAILVTPGRPADLAAAMERFVRDQELRERLEHGAWRTGADRLDWRLIAIDLKRYYSNCLN